MKRNICTRLVVSEAPNPCKPMFSPSWDEMLRVLPAESNEENSSGGVSSSCPIEASVGHLSSSSELAMFGTKPHSAREVVDTSVNPNTSGTSTTSNGPSLVPPESQSVSSSSPSSSLGFYLNSARVPSSSSSVDFPIFPVRAHHSSVALATSNTTTSFSHLYGLDVSWSSFLIVFRRNNQFT